MENPDYFTIKLYHGGVFSIPPGRIYARGTSTYIDFCGDDLDMHFLDQVMKELRYVNRKNIKYFFKKPDVDLDNGLHSLNTDEEVNNIRFYVGSPDMFLEVYTEYDDKRAVNTDGSPQYRRSHVRNLRDGSSCSRKLTYDG